MTDLPIVYRKTAKGLIYSWKIEVETVPKNRPTSNKVFLVTRFGVKDGKIQTNKRQVMATGRQDTFYAQGLAQAKKKWLDKQNKEGYRAKGDTTGSNAQKSASRKRKNLPEGEAAPVEEKRPFVSPMLAKKVTWKGDDIHGIPFPCYVQAKIDGFRCMATWRGDNVEIVSRKNVLYIGFPSLKAELKTLHANLPETGFGSGRLYLDGELFVAGVTFNQLSGTVKKGQNHADYDVDNLQYRIFDCFDLDHMNVGFETRYKFLQTFLKNMLSTSKLELLQAYLVPNRAGVEKYMQEFLEAGNEGLMARSITGPYGLKKRSSHLQKYKEFQDAEFEIVGFKEGRARDKGTVVWDCKASNGKIFSVRPIGTLEERGEFFKNGDTYIGKMLTVTFQDLSEHGVPRFPVGKAIRLDFDT